MNILVEAKYVRKLTEKEYKECYKATMGGRGCMQGELQRTYEPVGINPGKHDKAKAIIARDENGQFLGWGLLFYNYRDERTLYVYVYNLYRRQGVGRAIVKRALRHRGHIRVIPWNRTSESFFTPLAKNKRLKITCW